MYKRNKRILHIVGDSKFGGASILIIRLAQKAKGVGWDVDVLTADSIFQKALHKHGINVIKLNVIWRDTKFLRDICGLFKLYHFLKNTPYTIVHTHTSKGGFIGRLAARLAGVPVIIHTVHGFAFHEESSSLKVFIYSKLERLAAYWCDSIITVSNFHREWALKLRIGTQKKIKTIVNGISEERIKPIHTIKRIKEKLGIASNEFIILSIGRLAKQKGFEYLIEAVPKWSTKIGCGFKVFIIGEGPLRNILEEKVKLLGAQRQVKFLGFCKDIGDLLAVSDIIVLPSLREGLSISLLEAMAAGKPIITTTIGSNIEVVKHGETGILIPPKSSDKIVESILFLMKNEDLRKQLGLKAYQTFREYYTEERMLKEYIEEYIFLCKKKGIFVIV